IYLEVQVQVKFKFGSSKYLTRTQFYSHGRNKTSLSCHIYHSSRRTLHSSFLDLGRLQTFCVQEHYIFPVHDLTMETTLTNNKPTKYSWHSEQPYRPREAEASSSYCEYGGVDACFSVRTISAEPMTPAIQTICRVILGRMSRRQSIGKI
ncbi:unnamed protein product, partial [Allacma fusca]